MASEKNLLDLFAGMFARPTKGTLTRFHTTKTKNVPSILKEGLTPRMGGGFQDNISDWNAHKRQLGVFTSARAPLGVLDSRYWPTAQQNGFSIGSYIPWSEEEVTLRLEIPKEDYRNLRRAKSNNEVVGNYHNGNDVYDETIDLEAIPSGGRTDIFEDNLNPEWIKHIMCVEPGFPRRYYDCTDEFRMNFLGDKKNGK